MCSIFPGPAVLHHPADKKDRLEKHLKPILIIFASTLATTLYVSSDTTILGILGTDYNVGIYSVAGKIYGIVKNLLSAVLVVSIPRLSHYAGVGDEANFNKLFNNIFNALIVVVAPAVVGLFALSREVVLFISGKSYLDAVMPLQILSLALIVCLFGWLYNSCALLPCGREKELFWITLVSGLLNVGLNILLIPRFRENAAAFTTLLAELCAMMLCIRCSRGLVTVSADRRTVGSVLCGCAGIVLVCTGVKALALPNLICILAAVLGSVAAYAVILLGMKNPLVLEYLEKRSRSSGKHPEWTGPRCGGEHSLRRVFFRKTAFFGAFRQNHHISLLLQQMFVNKLSISRPCNTHAFCL